MIHKTPAIWLVIVVFLTACAGVPFMTLYKMKGLDPLEADPAQIKVAVRADERIGLTQGGAKIELKFDADDGSLQIDETYIIEIIRNPLVTSELLNGKKPGEAVTLLQLSNKDAQTMREVQSQLRPFRDGAGGGTLSFGVDLQGLCAHSPIPEGKILVDIFMQTSAEGDFLLLNEDLNLRETGQGEETESQDLTDCVDVR